MDLYEKVSNMTTIPVIDFQLYAVGKEGHVDLDKLGSEMCHIGGIGFCYLKNHGIPEETINEAFSSSKDFFLQPVKEKEKFARSHNYNFGWVGLEVEKLNPERPVGDYKEAWNMTPEDHLLEWPSEKVLTLSHLCRNYLRCVQICQREYLMLFQILKRWKRERKFLQNCHKNIGSTENKTSLRSLFYPALQEVIKEGQKNEKKYNSILRLGTEDQYVPATPIPGTVVVNIGDLMQRWTADKLKATKHRVLNPSNEQQRRQNRQSMAFFVHPDDKLMIECLDKSNKYEPITFPLTKNQEMVQSVFVELLFNSENQITSVLHTTKLSSTSDKAFEDSVSEVINFINDLPDTPRTREKVRKRFRKRMYNQKG
ncbi:unnamed protein product [Mytilus coruscus]|uniref:Fe2OG dioxygenase domain-containing protein n=1 Tax=Mytilus coruscus TaxID=42192 RepID=A0A6J8B9P0_MYTCO|nr:unnamed protein product [Mytilus coruscus]